jgi:hypothetical protein
MHIGRTLGVIGVVIFVSFSSMAQYTKYQPVAGDTPGTALIPTPDSLSGNLQNCDLQLGSLYV